MKFVIMRKDISSVLCNDKGWMIWDNPELVTKSAENYCGYPVPYDVAKKIITSQRIRIDCVSEANHNLIRLLDKPGPVFSLYKEISFLSKG